MFYRLYDDEKYLRAEWADEMDFEKSFPCPVDPHGHPPMGGKRMERLIIDLPSSNIGDFIWTWLGECIITDKVAGLFKEVGFTGYELRPVTVKNVKRMGKESNPIPQLWEMIITGWAGMAPPESGIKLIMSCNTCGMLRYSGLTNPSALINSSQWDGSDFFIVWPMPAFIFVPQKVKDFVEEKRLTGCQFIPVEKLETTGTGFGPGRLSDCMPESRARLLGEPLGIY